MRIRAQPAQARPLVYAELVLLVNHRQAQASELDVFLDQGLRSHHQIDFPMLNGLESRLSCLGSQSPRQEQAPYAAIRQVAPTAERMAPTQQYRKWK